MRTKIDDAAASTREVLALIAQARSMLDVDARVNDAGVFKRPRSYGHSVLAAMEMLTKAAALIEGRKWPTKEDYGEG